MPKVILGEEIRLRYSDGALYMELVGNVPDVHEEADDTGMRRAGSTNKVSLRARKGMIASDILLIGWVVHLRFDMAVQISRFRHRGESPRECDLGDCQRNID